MFGFVFLAPYARTTRYEEAFCPKAKNGLGRFAPSALPNYNRIFFYKKLKNVSCDEYDRKFYKKLKNVSCEYDRVNG